MIRIFLMYEPCDECNVVYEVLANQPESYRELRVIYQDIQPEYRLLGIHDQEQESFISKPW